MAPDTRSDAEKLKEVQEGYDRLDRNWSFVHGTAMKAIRDALGLPNASVPEMVDRIKKLRHDELLTGRRASSRK